jgi:citrate synthase
MTMSDVLFEITKEHLETGLRGVPVGYCTTSKVDPELGLSYVGIPVGELADKEPEDVIYLLLNKQLPDAVQAKAFRAELARRRAVSPHLINSLRALPRQGHPMKWFIHALNIMGMTAGTGDYMEDTLRLIARMPTVVAAIFRIRDDWGEPIDPDPSLGYMEDFVRMLGIPGQSEADRAKLVTLMKAFDILHFDHGGGNLSAFTGKAVASGLADLFESLTGAMCALAGPRHGKANQECLNFVEEFVKAVGGEADDETVAHMVRARLHNGQLIYGFGHAVLRVEDVRATILCELGEQFCPNDLNFRMVQVLRRVVPPILKENPKITDPYPNVDLASGSVLHACGITNHDSYTMLFGMSRVVGIAIQIIYERHLARGGKGTPIIRPKYLYDPKGSA